MKKILKISLFIIVFCLLLILFSNSQVQAVVETITTVQELQEVMGATEHSTIDGTTLKITDNFTWNLTEDADIKIPELIIDFNGKQIKIEKNSDAIIDIIEGNVIFKDLQENIGGIYCKGHTIEVENSTELIIENGQYIAEKGDNKKGVILNKGGTITIENGIFKCMDNYELFMIYSGKLTINNGNFEGKGIIIDAAENHISGNAEPCAELIINNGTFCNEIFSLIELGSRMNDLKVTINGGFFKSTKGTAISLIAHAEEKESASIKLNGCIIEANNSCLNLSGYMEKWFINLQNCTLKCTSSGIGYPSAIYTFHKGVNSSEQQISSLIKSCIKNYDEDLFWLDGNGGSHELTYKELVFKDGKLISAIGIPNDKENNVENNTDNNTENSIDNNIDNNTDNNTENNANNNAENNTENNIENNVDNNVDNKAENVTKLPQTGEETNVFTQWLSIVIILGIIWLGSMLLIDREKKKMTKK